VKRVAELTARRQLLLARCAQQRAELGERFAQLEDGPLGWIRAGAAAAATRPGRHPLAWVVAVAGLVLLQRPRQAVKLIGWTRTALTVLARVGEVMGVLSALRRAR